MTLNPVSRMQSAIIPYQELLGNYDRLLVVILCALYYTIPRAIREL